MKRGGFTGPFFLNPLFYRVFAMQFAPEVQSIVIGADNDEAGALAADKAAMAFTSRGLAVRILRPLEGFKDFNDELQGNRA